MIDVLVSYLVSLFEVFTFKQWLVIFFFITAYYTYNFYVNNLWKRLGVPYVTPLPIVGNDLEIVLGLKTLQDVQIVKYKKIGSRRFGGVFRLTIPMLFVKDPELIETMMTTDFSHFTDRGLLVDEKREPLTGHLFSLSGKKWKNLRNKLSPVFTSGKLKTMHHQLIDCADILMEVLEMNAKTSEPIDFKETMSKFTTDVIGTCAYGLNMNSLKDPDNEFRKMGRKVFETSIWRKIKGVVFFIGLAISPKLTFMLRLRPFPRDVETFFLNLVPMTIKAREQNPEFTRNDFIQLLMNLRQRDKSDETEKKAINFDEKLSNDDSSNHKDEVHLDDNMMAANSFLFFVAGFETTASTLTYCLFELAHHQDIQSKLYQEVTEVLGKHEGQPTYEAIKNLHYMDMVISETLRKYPPVPVLFRICTESYQIPGTEIVLPKGCRTEIPVYSLHHDPEIYPDPENFVPERFSPENKDSIPKGAYLPFGDGPRICIGARFAQMEIKVCLSKILSNFKILKAPGLCDVISFDPKSPFILIPKDEIKMIIERR